MKRFAILASLVLLGSTLAIAQKRSPQQLAKDFSDGYPAKTLGKMDAAKPYLANVTVIIEHSLEDKKVTRQFASLRKFESWLKGREHDGLPARESRPLKQCRRGICTFDFDGGILHNHLYLKRIDYMRSGGKYYIKAVRLLDGD